MWVLAFLPLAVWVWLQAQRIDALVRRVAELELQLFALRSAASSAPEAAAAAPAPQAPPPQDELLLTEVVPDDVLILDTPLPAASNDIAPSPEAPAASSTRPRMHSPLLLDEPIAEGERPPAPPPPPAAATPQRPPRRLDQWLAEKGLAWIAGIALAMGAIYLVSVAMQSTWFTPAVQLASAGGLGLVLLGVSELARRVGLKTPPGHPLIAALLAGAGVVTFYATAWAAHGVYQFVDWPAATALLTLCAIGLIALSFLHGEALGVLAIALALLAPALANAPLWPSLALTSDVALGGAGEVHELRALHGQALLLADAHHRGRAAHHHDVTAGGAGLRLGGEGEDREGGKRGKEGLHRGSFRGVAPVLGFACSDAGPRPGIRAFTGRDMSPGVPPPPPSPPAPGAGGLVRALGWASFLSIYVGAWAAVAVEILLGPSLAMMWVLVIRGNTEPITPAADFPLWLTVLAAALPWPLVQRRALRYAALASLPLLLLPAWHLHHLVTLSDVP